MPDQDMLLTDEDLIPVEDEPPYMENMKRFMTRFIEVAGEGYIAPRLMIDLVHGSATLLWGSQYWDWVGQIVFGYDVSMTFHNAKETYYKQFEERVSERMVELLLSQMGN